MATAASKGYKGLGMNGFIAAWYGRPGLDWHQFPVNEMGL
jgi:hypothetical protein